MKYILFTGATGLLGEYLLHYGLRDGLKYAVIVRPSRYENAAQRVESMLVRCEQRNGIALPRPVVLEGSLSESGLGLSAEQKRWVSQNCYAVLHNAASLEFYTNEKTGEPYKSNVDGTRNVLDFAENCGLKTFYHVSTAYIAGLRTGICYENELDVGQNLGNDYEKSKVAAEKMVRSAAFIDSLTVFRPAIIIGDSKTGYTSTYHGFYTPLKVAHALVAHVEPEQIDGTPMLWALGLNGTEAKNFVPVDWVAAVINYVLQHPETERETYHLVPRNRVSVMEMMYVLVNALKEFYRGRPPKRKTLDATLNEMQETFSTQMEVYQSYWRNDPIYDYQNVEKILPDMPCPKVDDTMLYRTAMFAMENNFNGKKPPLKKELKANPKSNKMKPIAVVAAACRLPKSNTPEEFWQLISTGQDAVVRVPDDRFDRKLYFNPKKGVVGKSYCEKAALIDYSETKQTDSLITEDDIRNADSTHILLCKVAQDVFRSGRISLESLRGKNVGVFLGHAAGSGLSGDYTYGLHIPQAAEYLREVDAIKTLPKVEQDKIIQQLIDTVQSSRPKKTKEHCPHLGPGGAVQLLKYKFGLTGPGMVFNSSCASALQAIGHAIKELQLGRIEAALTGGASCFHQDTLILFSAAQSLSESGTYPFTEKAEGLIPGEGTVLFYLKTLDKALEDGNEILAVLPNVGIASDGKGTSLWAPRKEGQIEAMRRAHENDSGINGLEYIEGHFTSTHLGDKTELESITGLLNSAQSTEGLPPKPIPVGSAKRNIGHGLEVAGAVGLLKVILSLKHETIPASVQAGLELNKDVDWNSLPVFVPDKNLAWTKHNDGTPRRAGVSAFGIGGLNVHLVVEDFVSGRDLAPAEPVDCPDIAIIGSSSILPPFNGEPLVKPLPIRPWNTKLFPDIPMNGVFIEEFQFDWKTHKVPPKQVSQANPLQFMILEAAYQTFQQAGIDTSGKYNHSNTGCIVGGMFGGDFSVQLVMGMRQPETVEHLRKLLPNVDEKTLQEYTNTVLKKMPALTDETGSFTASTLASRVTKTFNLMGGGVAVDSGNHSGIAALLASVDMLATNAAAMMMCVIGNYDSTPGTFFELALRNGKPVAVGEGCIALLLKRLDDAKRDGNKIYGTISAGNGVAQCAAQSTEDKDPPLNAGTIDFGGVSQILPLFSSISSAEKNFSYSIFSPLFSNTITAMNTSLTRNIERVSRNIIHFDATAKRRERSRCGTTPICAPEPVSVSKPEAVLTKNVNVSLKSSPSIDRSEVEEFCINYVIEQTEYPREMISVDEPLPDLGIDSIKKAQMFGELAECFDVKPREDIKFEDIITLRQIIDIVVEQQPDAAMQNKTSALSKSSAAPSIDRSEVEEFCINYVIEQTEYPREMISVDEPLPDLGIDSIKKAQMFGELAECFDVKPREDIKFEDIITLRQIIDIVVEG